MKIKLKQLLPKLGFAILFLPAAWYGFIFVLGFFIGREISQAEYRFLERGHRWSDINWRVYFNPENYKARDGGVWDTLLDISAPVLIYVLLLVIINKFT